MPPPPLATKLTRDAAALDLRMIRRATDSELAEGAQKARIMGARLDLTAFIRSRMRDYSGPHNTDALDALSEMNDWLRQRAGDAATGTWFPLSALAGRDLTSAGSGALHTATVTPSAATSLAPLAQCINAGAVVLSGLKGTTVGVPFLDTGVPAGSCWHHEGVAPPAAEPSFAQAVLVPKTLTVELVVSYHLLRDSSVSIDALLRAELARRIGAAIDQAALVGDGDAQPSGILEHPDLDVLSLGTDGAVLSFQDVCEMERRVTTPLPPGGALSWLAPPALVKKLRNTARNSATAILEGGAMLGHPVLSSANMPDDLDKGTSTGVCSALLLGDFSELVIGFWGPAAVDLMVDSVTLAYKRQVRLIARTMVGIVPRRIDAFCAVKDALTD